MIAAKAVFVAAVVLAVSGAAQADVIPTDRFTNFYDSSSTFNGSLIPVGSVIDAFDEDDVHCGHFVVHTEGMYGFMPVYGDAAQTPAIDEGADDDDSIRVTINGRPADIVLGDVEWANDRESRKVRLSVATANIQFSLVDPARDTLAAPGWTVRFTAGIRNEGDGLDFYGVTADVDQPTWSVIIDTTKFYADTNEVVQIYFDVVVPVFPVDTAAEVTFTVFSHLDPSVTVQDTALLLVSVTDVEPDDPSGLPTTFAVGQNYPNPFNPTTMVPFALPNQSTVHFEVYNALGQLVQSRDLGRLAAGEHEVEFDASSLASGVYLYRIVTEQVAETRKMVLIK